MQRFLITTADERSWRTDQPVFFLGEWCRLYSRKNTWQNLDAEVVPYHWDDREKLHQDYHYLQSLYEDLLQELASRLNAIHGAEYSLRYWRILVGPWLGYFVQMLFDRWAMIEQVTSNHSVVGVRVMEAPPEQVIPNDMEHFQRLFVTDIWNEAIYGQLLQGWTAVPIEKVAPAETDNPLPAPPPVLPVVRRLKRKLARALSFISPILTRADEVFFISTYLPIKQDFHLQWSLGQIPKLWHSLPTPKARVNWGKRRWQMSETAEEGFSAIVRIMIPRHIPALYLEGFKALQARCTALPWPQKPRLIFTSNAYSSDDVFKAWAAGKVEAGAPLVIGQHGGNYGMALWGFDEDHQIAISDAFLTWGWDAEGNPKTKPMGNLKLVGRDWGWNPKGDATMVEMTMPRYSYHMYSTPVAPQWLGYFEEQCRFMAALPQMLREQMVVRLYSHDFGWCQKRRWQDRFPETRLEDGVAPMAQLIEKSRLYISTYNSTTFLESLAMNIPTIIFWNPKHWELRDSAIPYFELLRAVGIFHDTPECAAAKVAEVWEDVPGWWNRLEVQEARKTFCTHYSHTSDQMLDNLKQAMNHLARRSFPETQLPH